MAAIEKRPLPAPNSPTIAESDRSRVYDAIGRELRNVLSGRQAYFPDGVQKDPQDIISNLEGFVASVENLRQNHVIDPSNVLGPLAEALKTHTNNLKDFFEKSERADPIELPPEISPTTRDNRVIHVDPFPGPESPPNPLSPRQRPQFYNASAQLPDGAANELGDSRLGAYLRLSTRVLGSDVAGNNLPNQPAPPLQAGPPLGIYSGKPMRQWIVPPPIWGH